VLSIGFRRKLYIGLFIAAMLNFLVFWLLALHLGGDALNGKAEAGHYFLMSHGDYTEVSEEVFNYSRWHAYSLWVTHPLGAMAAVFYYKLSSRVK
jgi:hypothetical protein